MSLKGLLVYSQMSYKNTRFAPLITFRQNGLSIPVFSLLVALFHFIAFYVNYPYKWFSLLPVILCSIYAICITIVIPKYPVVYFRMIDDFSFVCSLVVLISYASFTIILLVLKLFKVIRNVPWEILLYPLVLLIIQLSASTLLLSSSLSDNKGTSLELFESHFNILGFLREVKWLAYILKALLPLLQCFLLLFMVFGNNGWFFCSFFVNDWIWIIHPTICLMVAFFSKPPLTW